MRIARCSIYDEVGGQLMVIGYEDILCDENGDEIEVIECVSTTPKPAHTSFNSIVEEEPPF